MKLAIESINQLIQHYEGQKKTHVELFNAKGISGQEHVNDIYDNLIGELNQAIKVLKEHEQALNFSNQ